MIHPFGDGNGRVGRALVHVVLRRRELATRYVPPISLILATESRSYVGALTAYRYEGDPASSAAQEGLAELVSVFASACSRSVRDASEFAGRLAALEQEWRARVGARRGSAADLLLAALPAAPVITVARASRLVGRTDVAVNNAVRQLVEGDILTQVSAGRRNRAFEAREVLDELTRFERSLASPSGDMRIDPPNRPVPRRR